MKRLPLKVSPRAYYSEFTVYSCQKSSPSYQFNSLNFDSEKISSTTLWDHLKHYWRSCNSVDISGVLSINGYCDRLSFAIFNSSPMGKCRIFTQNLTHPGANQSGIVLDQSPHSQKQLAHWAVDVTAEFYVCMFYMGDENQCT